MGISSRAWVQFRFLALLVACALPGLAAAATEISEDLLTAEYDFIVSISDKNQYHVRHILLASREDALKAINMLRYGTDFFSIAKGLSLDTKSKAAGGDLGWVRPSSLPPAFSVAMKALKDGEWTKTPVQTPQGWHVIERIDTQPLPQVPYAQMRESIFKNLSEFAAFVDQEKANPGALDKRLASPGVSPARMRMLLQNGANPNIRNDKGDTRLYIDCLLGIEPNVRALLAAGADPNLATNSGATPLSASLQEDARILQRLLEAGANPNTPDGRGIYPIHHAAYQNQVDAIRLLIKSGASLEQRDKDGNTPLMIAALRKSVDAARVLLELGASASATKISNKRESTALDGALTTRPGVDQKQQDILVGMLRDATAKEAISKSKLGLEVFILQDKQRFKLDGKPITLKRANFTLLFQLKNTSTVLAHAGLKPLVLGQNQTTLNNKWDAAAESTTKSDQEIFVYPDGHGYQIWWKSAEGTRFDTFEAQGSNSIATREVRALSLVPNNPREDSQTVKVENFSTPLFLTFAVTESLGALEDVVIASRQAEIRWR